VHIPVVKGVSVRVILVTVFSFLWCPSVFAQSPTGSIGGIVFDPDAKSIPGAEIIVVNDLTRVQYETKTNDLGIYAVPNLPPGPYRVQASKVGFKTLIKPDIILNVQDSITINFTLPVGATSIAVTVEGGAPMINTTDASVSTVVDRQFAENIPMNGRSFQTLIYLTPGVVVTSSTSYDSGQFSVNGQRAASNYWMVDGVSGNIGVGALGTPGNGFGGTLGSFSALGGTNSLVSVDAMQEFRIQTSTFAPEFGRTPGGQISIVTRSGTNEFHGTAFDYLRNDAFDANNWFANSVGLSKPREHQNDFGGTLSRPIHVPGLYDGTGKAFFFFSYEGLRLRLPETTLSNVPDLAARQSAASAMQPYLNAYPLPNGTDDPKTGNAGYNASYSNPASLDAYSLRVDQKLGREWNLFGRYNYSPSELINRGGIGAFGALSELARLRVKTETFTIGATWAIAPTLANDLRFNYSRTKASSYNYLDTQGGAIPLASPPFPAAYTVANASFSAYIFGLGTARQLQLGKDAENTQHQINVVDNLSLQRGSHSLKVGFDFRRLSPETNPPGYVQTVYFNDVKSAAAGMSEGGGVTANNKVGLRFRNLGAFAQDTWHVVPRLTVTYGLRWDVDFAPSPLTGPGLPAITNFDLANLAELGIAPAGTPPFKTGYGNVAPRFGLAYQLAQNPNWQTVLRGGFGVFYDLVSAEAGNTLAFGAPPFSAFTVIDNVSFPFDATLIAPPPIARTATFPNIYAFDPNLKLPYTLEWNVTAEQSLGTEQKLSLGYIGASGRRLLQTTYTVDPPSNPNLQRGVFIGNSAASNYQALQIQFQRRLSRGLQAIASYTWSHSIDDASASSFGDSSNLSSGSGNANRGNSDFDIRNAFSAGLTYDIPKPHQNANAFLKAILGGWSTENFVLARSSPPVDVSDISFFRLAGGIYTNIRPDIVNGVPLYVYGAQCIDVFRTACPGGKGLNPAALTNPPSDPRTGNPTRQGDLPRNFFRGFGAFQWDFAVHREFPLHERLKLQFRAEMFNVLNHPNFGPPNHQFGEAGFGLSTTMLAQSLTGGGIGGSSTGGGGLDPLYQLGGPRSIQIALKLTF
jgi:hypothetical protein